MFAVVVRCCFRDWEHATQYQSAPASTRQHPIEETRSSACQAPRSEDQERSNDNSKHITYKVLFPGYCSLLHLETAWPVLGAAPDRHGSLERRESTFALPLSESPAASAWIRRYDSDHHRPILRSGRTRQGPRDRPRPPPQHPTQACPTQHRWGLGVLQHHPSLA